MNAVIKCIEEEYAPFFAYPTRRHNGWRWLPFYLRGPAWPGPFGFLLTLLGVWRFARTPIRIKDTPQEYYCGCTIARTYPYIGSYGMGGPGFLGLKCRKNHQSFWIVFILWASDGWLTLDGNLIDSGLFGEEKILYQKRGILPIDTIHGGKLLSVLFTECNVMLNIQKNGITHVIELRRDGTTVPPWRGSGEKKTFRSDESLEDSIILSRRARLWTED